MKRPAYEIPSCPKCSQDVNYINKYMITVIVCVLYEPAISSLLHSSGYNEDIFCCHFSLEFFFSLHAFRCCVHAFIVSRSKNIFCAILL